MKIEKIKQVFDMMAEYCEAHYECKWCPFSDDNSECKFKEKTGTIPILFENDFLEEEEIK